MGNTDDLDPGILGEVLEVYRQEMLDAHQRLVEQMLETQHRLTALCSVLGEPLHDGSQFPEVPELTRPAAETITLRRTVNELRTELAQLRNQELWTVAANRDLTERVVALRAEQKGLAAEMETLASGNARLTEALASAYRQLDAIQKQNMVLVQQLSGGMRGKPLGRVLVDVMAISEEQLEGALADQRDSGKMLGEILVDRGVSTEEAIAQCVAGQMELPLVRLFDGLVDKASLHGAHADLWQEHRCVPLRAQGERLVVAMANPRDEAAIARIQRKTGRGVARCMATGSEVDRTLQRAFCA